MVNTITTGSKILAMGDFRSFVIVDRIGIDLEIVSHLIGSNQRPMGQRGIYAMWRNTSKVLDANAFRVLVAG
jgi:HK97 family phage major capsid protein